MKKIALLAFVLVLLSTAMIGRFTKPVEASGTITINADGSVTPPTANITNVGNVFYTFNGSNYDSIVVERDNIVIDGAGYTLQGTGSGYGIDLSHRNNVTLKNVEVTNFHYGIHLFDSSNNNLTGNTASNNYRGIVIGFSHKNTISNNTLCSNGAGIYNGAGIFIFASSNNNVLTGNNATDNENGIYLWECSNNVLTGNTVSNNYRGIFLDISSNNNLTGNTASKNQYNFHIIGSVLSDFINYVDTSNTVDGKPIYYLIEEANVIIDAKTNAGTIYLINCNNITIRDLTLTKNGAGAEFLNTTNSKIENVTATNSQGGIALIYSSNNNVLTGNNATDNEIGIALIYSSNNNLTGNAASNNTYGIALWESSNNTLFHNNLINNTNQTYIFESFNNAWDDGYPSGGNYWSDYAGVDADGDGIGDTPYIIDADNNDTFPLMGPVSFFNAGTWDKTTYYVHTVSNSSVSDFYFNPAEGPFIRFNVTDSDDSKGFCRAAIPKAMLWVKDEPWLVLVGGDPPDTLSIFEDDDHTYLYFTYSHSKKTVEITGTDAIPEFPTRTSMLLILIVLTAAIAIHKRRPLKTPIS